MLRVLLLEDDEGDADRVSCALREIVPDVTVVHFRNGRDAIDWAESCAEGIQPDLVVTDLVVLGASNGHNLVACIRAQRRYDGVPVVVVSGVRDLQTIAYLQQIGANDFLVKDTSPSYVDALRGFLAKWVNRAG